MASYLIIKKINWSRSRDARIIFVSTSIFELSGTIIRVLDPRFQNGTHFWKAEGQLYKMDTKPENRLRHDPTLNAQQRSERFFRLNATLMLLV